MTDASDTQEAAEKFLRLTFNGGRFVGHRMPVDVLAELVSVQNLLRHVARQHWLNENPFRQRVPAGFDEDAKLQITSTAHNCFSVELNTVGPGDSYTAARDVCLYALAKPTEAPPKAFPRGQDAFDLLVALGRRLESNEALSMVGGGVAARVDRTTREQLAKQSHQPLEFEESLDGEVQVVDDKAGRLQLATDIGAIEVPFTAEQRSAVMQALELRPQAQLHVEGVLQRAQRRMRRVDALSIADHPRAQDIGRVWSRLDALNQVPDGWLDGEGAAPTAHALSIARRVLARLLADSQSVTKPTVFPTPRGGIQAEWIIGDWAAEIEFPADESGSVQADAVHVQTGAVQSVAFEQGGLSEDAGRLSEWLDELERTWA